MPYDERLAARVRNALSGERKLEEKVMFSGVCFMVNGKMCICVSKDRLLCRVGPEKYEEALERDGARAAIMGTRIMKGYVHVDADAVTTKKAFDYWVSLSLEFNASAKASKKKKPKTSASKRPSSTRLRK